jgi:hypothetical protein
MFSDQPRRSIAASKERTVKKMQLNVMFAFFPYGGNGGISSEHPSIRRWFAETLLKIKKDDRIDEVLAQDFSDTPITMTRNKAVQEARKQKADVLIMVDSDQHPDNMIGQDAFARPFWDSTFDFLYKRYPNGPVVVGAPYCGPPPCENVYVFRWANHQSDHPNVDMRLEQYCREEAAQLTGIQECAALPTGLIMFDMRVFDIVKPPYFYYEYTDEYESEKASTEDVTATRDMSLLGCQKLGYSPVYCNWDAWAGHWKPKCVSKPAILTAEAANEKYRDAVLKGGKPANERLMVMNGHGLDNWTLVKS